MVDVLITYETLYELLRREKTRDEIQKLDDNFYNNVLNYIKDKQAILESQKNKDNIFSSQEVQKTKKQLNEINRILRDLYEKRESKVINLALASSRVDAKGDYNNLLSIEKEFYKHIVEIMSSYRSGVLNNLLKGKFPAISEPKTIKSDVQNKTLVRFISAVPKFKGENGFVYGPFEEQDVANLPKEIEDLLLKSSRVEKI
jgi:DNA replication initiation complex subunit (GINS family)